MTCDDRLEAETSLCRVNKVCKGINAFLKIACVVFCVFWLLVAGFMAFSFSENDGIVLNIAIHLARGAVIAVLFIVLIGVFSDATKGQSPFTLKQVGRLRLIALSLLVYAVLEVVFSVSSVMMQLGSLNFGYISTNNSAIITFDFAPLIAAAVVFAFSFVFKYGVLLQDFSDDAL